MIRHDAYLVVENLNVVLQVVCIAYEHFEADVVADAWNARHDLRIAFMVVKLVVAEYHFVHRTARDVLVAKVA